MISKMSKFVKMATNEGRKVGFRRGDKGKTSEMTRRASSS